MSDVLNDYTFCVDAAVSIKAGSEDEARQLLKSCNLEEDILIGEGGVYFTPDALNDAELVDVYVEELV